MTKTIAISETIHLDQPAEIVWAYVEDYTNDIAWRAGLSEMTPTPAGPPQVGTRVREVVRKLGSTYVTNSTVTEVGPGHSYRFAGSGDSGEVNGGRSVVARSNRGAAFTYDIELGLSGFNALIGPLVRRLMTRGLRKDLARLRSVLETSPGSPQTAEL